MPRPKGLPKTPGSGRKRGTPNKHHRVRDRHEAMIRGMTPLQHMLSVMRDETAEPHRRDEMARSAAPYIHPRRLPETAEGKPGGTIVLSVNVDPCARHDE